MRIELHVKTIEQAADKRDAAQALLSEGDELVVIVGQPTASASAETQPRKQAVHGVAN
jgi:hypothetical protein